MTIYHGDVFLNFLCFCFFFFVVIINKLKFRHVRGFKTCVCICQSLLRRLLNFFVKIIISVLKSTSESGSKFIQETKFSFGRDHLGDWIIRRMHMHVRRPENINDPRWSHYPAPRFGTKVWHLGPARCIQASAGRFCFKKLFWELFQTCLIFFAVLARRISHTHVEMAQLANSWSSISRSIHA